MDLYSFKL